MGTGVLRSAYSATIGDMTPKILLAVAARMDLIHGIVSLKRIDLPAIPTPVPRSLVGNSSGCNSIAMSEHEKGKEGEDELSWRREHHT